MEPYAVLETGGKQYLVRAGDQLKVERLEAPAGARMELRPVLARSNGSKLEVGTPTIEGAGVVCTVLSHIRGPKLRIFKKRRRKTYARRRGHRQELSVLKIESIL